MHVSVPAAKTAYRLNLVSPSLQSQGGMSKSLIGLFSVERNMITSVQSSMKSSGQTVCGYGVQVFDYTAQADSLRKASIRGE